MNRRPLFIGITAAILAAAAALGSLPWASRESAPERTPTTAAHTAQGSPERVTDDADSPPLRVYSAAHSQLLEAARPGEQWTSERLSDQVTAQLRKLEGLVQQGLWKSPQACADLTTDGFQAAPLRPESLSEAFTDTADGGINVSLSVKRAEAASAVTQPRFASLHAALEQLWSAHKASEWELHLKIVHLERSDEELSAELYVHAHVPPHRDAEARVLIQQNAVWHTRWTLPSAETPPRLNRITLAPSTFEEITADAGQPWLADCTASALPLDTDESGILHQLLTTSQAHWTQRIEAAYGMDVGAFHGLAVGDANGDGLEDLYLCMPGGLPNCLLQQNANGTVTNIASQAGLDLLDFTRHALFVDLDNDGDQDLPMLINGALVVFENQAGRFSAGQPHTLAAIGYSLSAADIDNDGLLDLHVTGRDAQQTEDARSLLGDPIPYHDATNGGSDAMFRNRGQLRFVNVTTQVGLADNRFSQAASWEDYDNDGDLDLYVANDFGRNALYQNSAGRFRNVAATAGVEDLAAGMSVSWGDYNRDGQMDLYVSNMFSSAGNRVAYQRSFLAEATPEVRSQFQRHARGNTLFANNGDGTFRDVSVPANVTMGRWAWSSAFCDLNNDGWQDILVANGFITNEQPDDL